METSESPSTAAADVTFGGAAAPARWARALFGVALVAAVVGQAGWIARHRAPPKWDQAAFMEYAADVLTHWRNPSPEVLDKTLSPTSSRPPLYFVAMAAWFLLFQIGPTQVMFLNAACHVLLGYTALHLGRRLVDDEAGRVLGALTLACPLVWSYGHDGLSDLFFGLMCTAAALVLLGGGLRSRGATVTTILAWSAAALTKSEWFLYLLAPAGAWLIQSGQWRPLLGVVRRVDRLAALLGVLAAGAAVAYVAAGRLTPSEVPPRISSDVFCRSLVQIELLALFAVVLAMAATHGGLPPTRSDAWRQWVRAWVAFIVAVVGAAAGCVVWNASPAGIGRPAGTGGFALAALALAGACAVLMWSLRDWPPVALLALGFLVGGAIWHVPNIEYIQQRYLGNADEARLKYNITADWRDAAYALRYVFYLLSQAGTLAVGALAGVGLVMAVHRAWQDARWTFVLCWTLLPLVPLTYFPSRGAVPQALLPQLVGFLLLAALVLRRMPGARSLRPAVCAGVVGLLIYVSVGIHLAPGLLPRSGRNVLVVEGIDRINVALVAWPGGMPSHLPIRASADDWQIPQLVAWCQQRWPGQGGVIIGEHRYLNTDTLAVYRRMIGATFSLTGISGQDLAAARRAVAEAPFCVMIAGPLRFADQNPVWKQLADELLAPDNADYERSGRFEAPEGLTIYVFEPALARARRELADCFERGVADVGGDGQFSLTTADLGGDVRRAGFIHPPLHGGLTQFTVSGWRVPRRATALVFAFAMRPEVWNEKTDGVEFTVRIEPLAPTARDTPLEFRLELHPQSNAAGPAWVERRVDLTSLAGRDVRIAWTCSPGPAGHVDFDHGLIALPRIAWSGAPQGSESRQ